MRTNNKRKQSYGKKVLNNGLKFTRKISYFQLYNSIFRSIFNEMQQSWSQNLSLDVFLTKYKV